MLAVGAGRGRLFQQLVVESLLYGFFGGLLGILLAFLGIRGLVSLIPVDLPVWLVLAVDYRVLAFAVLISAGTSLVFGLVPLPHYMRLDLNEILKQGSKGSGGSSTLAGKIRGILVVAEVAFTLVLLLSAGLMLRSLNQVMSMNTGLKQDNLLVVIGGKFVPHVSKQSAVAAYSDEYRRIVERVAALPGVIKAGSGSGVPLRNPAEQRPNVAIFTRDHATLDTAFRLAARGADVMPGYFDALGVPLLEGRDFRESDVMGGAPVVIVSKRLAETLFPGHSAIGERLRWGINSEFDPWMTVIGVVGNTRWQIAERVPGHEVYWTYRQYPGPNAAIFVRTAGNPVDMMASVRQTIAATSPEFAIEEMKPMRRVAEEAVWQRSLWVWVLSAFAGIALLLSAVGLYGVINYLVTQRTRELGIRIAIGATQGGILTLVLKQGFGLVLTGVVLGLVGSVAAARALKSLLWGIPETDALTFVSVSAILISVAMLACALPASRAARIDPLVALREE